MTLRGEIVDFIRRQTVNQIEDPFRAAQISIVQQEPCIFLVRILINVIDALRVERTGASNHSMHLISMGQEQLRQVGAVLPRDACNQRTLH